MPDDAVVTGSTSDASGAGSAPSSAPAATPGSGGSPASAPSGGVSPASAAPSVPSGPSPAAAETPTDESQRDPRTGKFTKRPSLPGVHTSRDIRPIKTFAERRAERVAKERLAAEGKPGDGGAVPLPGQPAKPGDAPPAPDTLPGGGAPKFKFAGREWDSQEHAEQNFSTLQGLHRSLNQQVSTLKQNNQANQYSASEWKRVAEQTKAELDALQSGQPTGKGGAGGATGTGSSLGASKPLDRIPESADDILADVDLGLVAEIAEERGPLAATHLLLTESLNRLLPAFRAEIERAQAPFAQYAETAAVTQQAQGLIEDLGTWVKQLPDGTRTQELLYPELSDPAALNKIAALWEKLGLAPEVAMSPMGLMTAILHYRNMVGLYGGNAADAGSAGIPGAPSSPQAGAAAAAAAVTARLTGQAPGGDALSGPGGVVVRPASGPESDADRIRREVREAPSIDKMLGFVPKRGRSFTTA